MSNSKPSISQIIMTTPAQEPPPGSDFSYPAILIWEGGSVLR